jgi:hypothetical protein
MGSFLFHNQAENNLSLPSLQFLPEYYREIIKFLMNDYSFNGYLTQALKDCQVFFSIFKKNGPFFAVEF